MMGWSLIVGRTDAGYVVTHIMPEGDLFDHETSARCWCHPDLDEEDWVAMHHSADGREDFEQGRRKPS
jgi:hypothetical protein